MKALFKKVLINILVFAILLIVVNAVCFFLPEASSNEANKFSQVDRYLLNTNGKSTEYNRKVFEEFYDLKTDYVPYLIWTRKPYRGETTTVDSSGDRVTMYHPTVIHDTIRHIRFFGGSAMWGTGVDDFGTIPSYYQKNTTNELVHNHGESGFVSRQNLSRLINLLNQNEPIAEVYFYDGFNDILTLCRAEVEINSHDRTQQINHSLQIAKEANRTRYVFAQFFRYLFVEHTLNYFRSRSTIKNKWSDAHYKCCSDEKAIQDVVNTLCNNWRLAYELCKARNIDFHAVLQPSAYVEGYIPHENAYKGRTDCMPEIYPKICKMVASNLKGEPWFHDLTHVFDGVGPLYMDACHVSDRGNQIVADTLLKIKQKQDSTLSHQLATN